MTISTIKRNSKGLVNLLFDELEDLNSGRSTPQQARAKASMANSIIAVSRLEMDYARFVASERSGEGQLKPLPLG